MKEKIDKSNFNIYEYQELFEYMANEHGVTLLLGELQEIVDISNKIITKQKKDNNEKKTNRH